MRSLLVVTTWLAFSAPCSSCTAPKAWTDWNGHLLTIQTSNGPITGHPAPNATQVVEYLGIPYAQPPVGSLRFAPPASYIGGDPYVASEWGFDCPNPPSKPFKGFPGLTPQADSILGGGSDTIESEDCLTLNIWSRPSHGWHRHEKAVLVFFYGGRFTTGSTNTPLLNGQYFADAEDVVVVTVNYRINIFGFPGAPGHTQNAGMRDQRVAIEWLSENVAGFGGDPSKITIFGQSAGAVAVDYLAYAYADDPIVNGFIQESGNAFSFPLNNMSTTSKNWYNVSTELGCGSSGDTIDCMRQQDWEDIKKAAGKISGAFSGTLLRPIPAFYPVPDGEIIFSDYLSFTNAGKFARLPHLIGNNDNEGATYAISALGTGLNASTYQLGQDFVLGSFACPDLFEATKLTQFGQPAWLYRYMADWENTRLYEGSGTWHTLELYSIFGTSEDVTGIPPSQDEKTMSRLFQTAWATFADDPVSGLSKVLGWPEFNPDTESLIRLGYENQPIAEFVSPGLYDAPCSTIELAAIATGT